MIDGRSPDNNCRSMSEMMNLSLDDFSELIGLIYEGLREPVPWGSLLVALRKFLKANWATLILRPASLDQPALLIRAGDRGAEIYGAAYNQYNVFSMDPFVGLPPDKVVTLDEMIDTQQWVNGEFYRQFIAPNDIRHILGSDLRADDGAECRLRITRPAGTINFSACDKALCQMLLPHIKRAVNLRAHFGVIESERRLGVGFTRPDTRGVPTGGSRTKICKREADFKSALQPLGVHAVRPGCRTKK